MPEFITICARCKKEISRRPLPANYGAPASIGPDIISHGYCPACAEFEEGNVDAHLDAHLEERKAEIEHGRWMREKYYSGPPGSYEGD